MSNKENKKQDKKIPIKTAIIIIVFSIMMGILIFGGIAFFIFNSTNSPETAKVETVLKNMDNETNIENDEYNEELGWILGEMEDEVIILTSECGIISKSWLNGILTSKDINQAVHEGLQIIDELNNKYDSKYRKDERKESIKERLQKITNPPEQYQVVYNLTVEAYGYYLELFNLAKEPSGSYESYVDTYKKTISEFEKIIEKISVTDPSINID